MAIISGYIIARARARVHARAQDISPNIDPIDLQFSGLIYWDIRARMKLQLRNPLIFSIKNALDSLVQRMIKIMPKSQNRQKLYKIAKKIPMELIFHI